MYTGNQNNRLTWSPAMWNRKFGHFRLLYPRDIHFSIAFTRENSKVVKSNVINKDDDVDDLDSASDTETDTSQQQSDGMIAANGRSGSPVFYANSHELVKNEPAIDIEFNAIQELNVEQSEEKLWNEVVAATNSEM